MRRKIMRGVRAVWITAGLAFTAWMYIGFQPAGLPDGTLASGPRAAVAGDERGLDFRPIRPAAGSGLIFLPGGMVNPVAYAPLLKRIAEAGYRAHLAYLPMRCACTAAQIESLFAEIQAILAAEPATSWVLAGHSRGAMLAARFVHESAAPLAGLVLIGTTHPRDFSLAGITLPVTRIYGTKDGIAPYEAMRRNRHLLPPGTEWIQIAGGNHVQFGYYRHQLFDGAAAIPRADQQRAVETALLQLLARLN